MLFRLVVASIAIGKFVMIGVVFSPYLKKYEHTTLLYILQCCTVAGIGLVGIHEVAMVSGDTWCTNIMYTTPFLTLCWMLHITNEMKIRNEEYNMSVYIAICYFTTPILLILISIIGVYIQGNHICDSVKKYFI